MPKRNFEEEQQKKKRFIAEPSQTNNENENKNENENENEGDDEDKSLGEPVFEDPFLDVEEEEYTFEEGEDDEEDRLIDEDDEDMDRDQDENEGEEGDEEQEDEEQEEGDEQEEEGGEQEDEEQEENVDVKQIITRTGKLTLEKFKEESMGQLIDNLALKQNDDDDDDDDDDEKEDPKVKIVPWKKGHGVIRELDFDSTAYGMLHSLSVDWPCLSFAIYPDSLGFNRTAYPHTIYFVGGSQADKSSKNQLIIAKASQLGSTTHDEDEDEEKSFDLENSDSDNEDSNDPILENKIIYHSSAINRVKLMPQLPSIAATMDESAKVGFWDLNPAILSLDTPGMRFTSESCRLGVITRHKSEGYALDWSPVTQTRLATGDNYKLIYIWQSHQAGQWEVITSYINHTSSIEDIQWSPTEANVFASCSSDETIKIFDVRIPNKTCVDIHAHVTDVNVISWNKSVTYLLASGADDGSFKIWDFRSPKEPAAVFNWHEKPITSIEWNPNDSSEIVVGCADDQITIWDLSVEKDEQNQEFDEDFPPQLLFAHLGQKEIKEVHWHPQIPGGVVSTAANGFNFFIPAIQVEEENN
eukprot:TRINITY_DN278_c0_g3_i1.p1 TRINITY_DN278_c0_g3~~TRINITY_DN278_c0_g3_i1.p1  ORF type:complete len:599 (+),score=329.10 TRINITY_DN278_c0_g3_i1:46-1797(+)